MTQLTNLSPSSSYGDLLTGNNSGNGLNTVLQNVQDGFGNNTILQVSTNAFNIDTSLGQFRINGTTLTATATQINNVCVSQNFSGTAAITVPVGTTAQQPAIPSTGMIRYNTTTNKFEGRNNVAWVDLS